MKNLITILLVALFAASCSTDNDPKCAKIARLDSTQINNVIRYYFVLSDGYKEEVNYNTFGSYAVGDTRCR